MYVPYLPEEPIERAAESLLSEFASRQDAPVQPPVPIEDIVEKHLRLSLGFDGSSVCRGPGPNPTSSVHFGSIDGKY